MNTDTYILAAACFLGWILAFTYWYRFTYRPPLKLKDVEVSTEGRGPNADSKYKGAVVEQPALFTEEDLVRAYARAEKYNWKG